MTCFLKENARNAAVEGTPRSANQEADALADGVQDPGSVSARTMIFVLRVGFCTVCWWTTISRRLADGARSRRTDLSCFEACLGAFRSIVAQPQTRLVPPPTSPPTGASLVHVSTEQLLRWACSQGPLGPSHPQGYQGRPCAERGCVCYLFPAKSAG